mmetsp:Transcript_33700/g.100436  ORF Transcript_33700/g.100436 Transcript_33700/m.100436 type:complete len:258 (-) Transcript_33700:94-867(-)
MSDMEKAAALDRAEKQLRSANGTKRSYKMECRLVGDPAQRQRYENQLTTHERDLSALANDVKALKSEAQRGQLFVGATNDAGGEIDPEATGDYLLGEASKIQDKTATSLDNTKNMVAASKEVGMSTMEELQRQRAQIESIDREAMRMEDNLTRADKLIKTFGRRMATDKFIQCCACLNVCLLVGVIIYSIVKGGLPTADDQTPPPDPTDPQPQARMLQILRAGAAFLRGASSTTSGIRGAGTGEAVAEVLASNVGGT